MFEQLNKFFIKRQFWMTYRAALTGLLARNEPGTYEEVAREAARHARAALYELARERGETH